MKNMPSKRNPIFSLLLIALFSVVINNSVLAGEELDEAERGALLEKTLTKLYYYPVNRLLDLHDIVQFGIAGCLGFGAELAFTEHCSLGGYYTAREAGIAYHGHAKEANWLDYPILADPIATPTKLVTGLDNKTRKHKVEKGYSTASLLNRRYESSDTGKQHFKRFGKKAVIHNLMPTEGEEQAKEHPVMNKVDEFLHPDNEAAIRGELVAGVVHPYVALELYETLDAITGFFFLDLKSDDWEVEGGNGKLRKLGRGITNIFAGVIEIPLNIIEVDKDDGGFAAVTYGSTRGIWRFMVRSVFVGPWEVLTFPTNTASIVEPEFPFLSTTSAETTWRVKYK